MVYFSYFHSILKYGIFWGGNSTNNSRVFKLQKKVIRIISGVGPRDSCRNLFKKLDILPLPWEYIISLMLFVIDNQNNFCSGLEVHCLNIRSWNQLYLPISNLSVFQNGTMCTGILDYLIDFPWPFKILERIELVLKTNCFYILWIIHLYTCWTFGVYNEQLVWTVFCLSWYVMTSFISIVSWTYEMWNVCMYVCTKVTCL
jgi:hypothetical protein